MIAEGLPSLLGPLADLADGHEFLEPTCVVTRPFQRVV